MSTKSLFDENELEKWTHDSFIYRPFLTSWIGAWFVFFGVTVLLIADLFLEYRPKRADWTSFWGMVLVLIGGSMFSASTFINQPILISVGGVFLTLGLCLYMTFLAWKLHDDYDYDSSPGQLMKVSERRAVLGMISMITVLVGIYFFVVKSIQRFIQPYLGPNNFFLYGPMLFGAGSFSYFLLNIKYMSNVDHDQYKPTDSSSVFGGYLFSTGAFLLLLAVSRSYYSYDLLIVPSFPSMVQKAYSCMEALFLSITTGIMYLGGFLIVVGEVLLYRNHRYRMVAAASVLICIGYLAMAYVSITERKRAPASIFMARLLQAFAMAVFTLGTALKFSPRMTGNDPVERGEYADDLRSASGAIGLIGSMLPFLTSFVNASPELFSPGNFCIIGDVFSFAAFMTQFLVGLAISTDKDHSCLVACNGSRNLAAIFFSSASMMYFFYHALTFDLALISDPFPKSIAQFLLRLRVPIWIVSHLLGESKASHIFHTTSNPHVRTNVSDLFYDDVLEEMPELTIPEGATVWETDVLIVGCGPTGLTLANEVGQRGVDTTIIDMRQHVLPDSRFFNLMYTTVEGLKKIGVMSKIFARSIPQSFGHGSVSSTGFTHPDNKVIGSAHGPGRAIQKHLGKRLSSDIASMVFTSKYAEEPSHRVMQGTQEQCLKERAEEFPAIKVRYGWELLGFQDKQIHNSAKCKSVVAHIRNVATKEEVYIKSDYIVGCDGPSSLVSKALKTKFDGYANLGQTRTIHIKTNGLLAKIRPLLGEVLQYHVSRPGYGVGWFVLNHIPLHEGEEERWTFFLMGLSDGRMPRQLSKDEMVEVVREFIGPASDVSFEVVSDVPWFWNLFFARRILYGHCILAGDSFHSWPPFGGIGGNTGYGDASNLGWKLAAMCKGWGHEGMLISYDIERRQFGLKIIMIVLNFAPDRSQLLRLATIAKYPWLWWTIRYRWAFASRGSHAGNHYANDGALLGGRYMSHIIYYNEEHQGIPTLESPPSRLTPSIAAGGRTPHIRFPDGSSVSDRIAFDGYTLLVIDPASIRVRDVIVSDHSHLLQDNLETQEIPNPTNDALMSYPVIAEIVFYFKNRHIPLKLVDLRHLLSSVKDPVETPIVNLYKEQLLMLIRPDLVISWHINFFSAVAGIVSISTSDLKKIAEMSCAQLYVEEDVIREKQTSTWLTRRFITNIQGYKHLHKQAIYFENQDKSAVIHTLTESLMKANPNAHLPPISLVTKATTLWEGEEGKEKDKREQTPQMANTSESRHINVASIPVGIESSHGLSASDEINGSYRGGLLMGDIYTSGYTTVAQMDNPAQAPHDHP